MPWRTVLSKSQREAFERLPVKPSELVRYYTLGPEDLELVRKRRRARNRVGFAVQLCLMRYPGRRLRPGEILPPEILSFVAEQTGDSPSVFEGYANRQETRREHSM